MKTNNIFSLAAGAVLCLASVACDGEKDLIIIDGDLPIKTSTLYLVGDATPNGWSIDSPTPLQPTEADPLVFTWEGALNQGEFKVCLTTGSWDAPFIRPKEAGMEVSAEPITDAKFKMHAGDPDDKWKVTEAGVYLLSFDLRNWTMSTSYVSAPPAPVIEPIECDALYMVGDAAPCGWNIDAPFALEKVSKYLYRYSGSLNAGELKLCTQAGSWDVSFIRPASDGVEINSAGVQEPSFVFTAGPDNKWRVTEAGEYVLEFDLAAWTISATRTGDTEQPTDPIESATLFMIGDATPAAGAWTTLRNSQ